MELPCHSQNFRQTHVVRRCPRGSLQFSIVKLENRPGWNLPSLDCVDYNQLAGVQNMFQQM